MNTIKNQDYEIIKRFNHPNCGTYAIEVEDMKGRHWIVPPEDIEEPEFMVDSKSADVLQIFQQDGYGIVGYLVQFSDGRKLLTEHVDVRPMIDEYFKYEKFNRDNIPF